MNETILPSIEPAHACHCLGGELPKTLSELDASESLTYLEGDLETLALLGTQLSDALISTSNGAAFLAQKGGYASFTTTAMPHRLSHKRINLRIAPGTPMQLARSAITANGRQSVVLANTQGEISHRIELKDAYDQAVIASLSPSVLQASTHQQTCSSDNIISLAAIRCARDCWNSYDTGQHLNDTLVDGGKIRLKTLPHVGMSKASRVLKDVLISFLTHLHKQKISYAQNLVGTGLIQSALSLGGSVELFGRILTVQKQHQTFALDLAQLASVWVTRIGGVSHLEIYGQDDHAIVVLSADPKGNIRHWNMLLASLPPPEYKL